MADRTFNYKRDVLGYGLLAPLRRLAGSDFAAGYGEKLVEAAVRQILGTRQGELPWRPDFGHNLDRYRHKNLSTVATAAMRSHVQRLLTIYEPRLSIVNATVRSEDNKAFITVGWTVRSAPTPYSDVILGPVTQEVVI